MADASSRLPMIEAIFSFDGNFIYRGNAISKREAKAIIEAKWRNVSYNSDLNLENVLTRLRKCYTK